MDSCSGGLCLVGGRHWMDRAWGPYSLTSKMLGQFTKTQSRVGFQGGDHCTTHWTMLLDTFLDLNKQAVYPLQQYPEGPETFRVCISQNFCLCVHSPVLVLLYTCCVCSTRTTKTTAPERTGQHWTSRSSYTGCPAKTAWLRFRTNSVQRCVCFGNWLLIEHSCGAAALGRGRRCPGPWCQRCPGGVKAE